MIPLREVDLFGVFVTPALPCFVAALALSYVTRRVFDFIDLSRFVWNRAFFDVSVLICITSLLVLSLRYAK